MSKTTSRKSILAWVSIPVVLLLLLLSSCGYLNSLYESNPTITAYFVIEGTPHKIMREEMVKTARQQGFYVKTYEPMISFEDDFWASFVRKDIIGHASTAGDKGHFTISLNKSKYFAVPTDGDVFALSDVFTEALREIEGVTHDRNVVRGKEE